MGTDRPVLRKFRYSRHPSTTSADTSACISSVHRARLVPQLSFPFDRIDLVAFDHRSLNPFGYSSPYFEGNFPCKPGCSSPCYREETFRLDRLGTFPAFVLN